MLEKEGYPFKSKEHSENVDHYNRRKDLNTPWMQHYLNAGKRFGCPEFLKYQLTEDFQKKLKISDKCCLRLKEQPLADWCKKEKKKYGILGLMRSEGGRRVTAKCLAFRKGKFKNFQPLVAVTKSWEDWFVEKYSIELSEIYGEPYNFERTGCKGCPFALHLQEELDTLEKFFPKERKQCEAIWKPVYDEYRRIGYRLKPITQETNNERSKKDNG